MLDVLDDHGVFRLVDAVNDAPLGPEAGAVGTGQGVAERPADALRCLQERPGDELDRRCCDVVREQFGDRSPGRAGHPELVGSGLTSGAQRLRLASRERAASTP